MKDIVSGGRTVGRKVPKRWLDACKREGIKPGLWFSTNLLHRWRGKYDEDYSEWESSVAEDGTTLVCSGEDILHHLMQTLQMYVDMGIKMFKFDFAYFDAATPDAKCTMLPTDIEEQNKNAFISAIKEFRYRNPMYFLLATMVLGVIWKIRLPRFEKR